MYFLCLFYSILNTSPCTAMGRQTLAGLCLEWQQESGAAQSKKPVRRAGSCTAPSQDCVCREGLFQPSCLGISHSQHHVPKSLLLLRAVPAPLCRHGTEPVPGPFPYPQSISRNSAISNCSKQMTTR